MKTLVRVLICAVVFVSLPSLVSAQQGYSVADNGQRLIQFDVTTGSATDVGPVNTNTEQEGLFSSGSFLMGYSEFDSALASPDLQNPGTRFLPTPGVLTLTRRFVASRVPVSGRSPAQPTTRWTVMSTSLTATTSSLLDQ